MEDNKNIKPEIPGITEAATETDMKTNQKIIKKSLIFAGVFVVIIAAVFAFRWFGNRSAENAVAKADVAALTATDSISAAQAMELYTQVANDGSYASNERAQIYVAADAYSKGEYEKALTYLDKVSANSDAIATGVDCLKGDCYVNLGKYEEAIDEFEDALDKAEGNAALEPYVLTKMANTYRAMGKADKEAETLTKLRTLYPNYNPTVDADIARALASENK